MDIQVTSPPELFTDIYRWIEDSIQDSPLLLVSGGSQLQFIDTYFGGLSQISGIEKLQIGLVDERFGPPTHPGSNYQRLIKLSAIQKLLELGVGTHEVLQQGFSIQEVTSKYYQYIKDGLTQPTYAVVGIGTDGHTAGILPNQDSDFEQLVVGYHASIETEYPDRVTLGYSALMQVARLAVYATGADKCALLQSLVSETGDLPMYKLKQRTQLLIATDCELHPV